LKFSDLFVKKEKEIEKNEPILCCMCKKNIVESIFEICKECKKEYSKQKIIEEQNKMRGIETIRIMRCEKCGCKSFNFIWKYDIKEEFNMIWCHDGIGFELDSADKICNNCGNKSDPELMTIDNLFGEWINVTST